MIRKLCTCAFLFILTSFVFVLYESGHVKIKLKPFNREKIVKTASARIEKGVDIYQKGYIAVEHVANTGTIDMDKFNEFAQSAFDFVGFDEYDEYSGDESSDGVDESSSDEEGSDNSVDSADEDSVKEEPRSDMQQEGLPPPPAATQEMVQEQQQQQQVQPQQDVMQGQQEQLTAIILPVPENS